jgi:hypothetical protein
MLMHNCAATAAFPSHAHALLPLFFLGWQRESTRRLRNSDGMVW